jgi:hypothetical protein
MRPGRAIRPGRSPTTSANGQLPGQTPDGQPRRPDTGRRATRLLPHVNPPYAGSTVPHQRWNRGGGRPANSAYAVRNGPVRTGNTWYPHPCISFENIEIVDLVRTANVVDGLRIVRIVSADNSNLIVLLIFRPFRRWTPFPTCAYPLPDRHTTVINTGGWGRGIYSVRNNHPTTSDIRRSSRHLMTDRLSRVASPSAGAFPPGDRGQL